MKTMPRILLIGKEGQVGWELARLLAPLSELTAIDRPEIDLSNANLIEQWIRDTKPQFIVNAAAYTDVEKAEDEKEIAMAINGRAPGLLAQAAQHCGATLIHYSTDYVFGKRSNSDLHEQSISGYREDDSTSPLNVYGETKREGERAIQAVSNPYFIFRTSWVYGLRGKNFLLSILKAAKTRETLRVVADQVGTPTWSRSLAEMTVRVVQNCTDETTLTPASGLYHLTGRGQTTWHGFAVAIIEAAKKHCDLKVKEILPVETSAYPTRAIRPSNSLLNCKHFEKAFQTKLPDWQETLETAMAEFKAALLDETPSTP